MARILLDLSNAALKKIHQMAWDQLYRDRGFRWEAILSRKGPAGQRIYSLRITRRMRAAAFREGDYLRVLSIHADHDSTYEWGRGAAKRG